MGCCCPGCDVVTDSFTEDTSSDYSQVSGTWSWDTGTGLVETSDDGALLLANKQHKSSAATATAIWELADSPVTIRTIIGYQDANNYYYARLVGRTATPNLKMRLSVHHVSGGSDTEIAYLDQLVNATGPGLPNTMTLTVCLHGDGTLVANASATGFPTQALVAPGTYSLTGRKGGVMAETADSPSKLMSFYLGNCPACAYGCCNGPWPDYWAVYVGPLQSGVRPCLEPIGDATYILPSVGSCDSRIDSPLPHTCSATHIYDYIQLRAYLSLFSAVEIGRVFPDISFAYDSPPPNKCEDWVDIPITGTFLSADFSTVGTVTGTVTAVYL